MPLTLDAHPALDATRPFADEPPKEAMRRTVRALLEAPEPTAEVDALFDVPVMVRRCHGRHWPEQTPAERVESSRALGALLASTLRATLGSASRLRYTGQSASGPLVTVRAEVALEGRPPAALELRVHRARGRWLVNDFVVDGASFVAQHRARLEHALVEAGAGAVSSPR
jgi:ABC-type transporter MlaC component